MQIIPTELGCPENYNIIFEKNVGFVCRCVYDKDCPDGEVWSCEACKCVPDPDLQGTPGITPPTALPTLGGTSQSIRRK